jgi:hypothetical protein
VILKIDLHTHTWRYSRCARHSPEQLCETALACGLNALAITEHHRQWSPREIARLQARYPALKLYAGVEITCTDGHDYVVLGLDTGHYSPNPISYPRLKGLLDAHPGAFAFIAHCFRFSDDESGLADRAIEGIEMASCNMLVRPQPSSGPATIAREDLYRRWQQQMDWIALYNSDAHSATTVGTFYNLVDAPDGPPENEQALIQLLRTTRIRPFQNGARIRAALNGR